MIFCETSSIANLDDRRRQMAERDFQKAVNEVLNRDDLSVAEMMELFDEDGYLGSAMRRMLSLPPTEDLDQAA